MYQDAWKRFYIAKPKPTEGNGWLRGTQLVMMTSTGRLLAGSVKYGDRNGLGPALREVLQEYAKLPEAERRASSVAGKEKPVPAPPPGGLVLTIYDRPLGRVATKSAPEVSATGEYRLPAGRDFDGFRTHAPHGQRGSLWLTEQECRSLVPQELRVGASSKVPAKLVKRLCLLGMWPQTLWVVEQAWQPDSLRDGALQLTVEKVGERTVRLRVNGNVLLSGKGPLKLYPTGKVLKTVENRYDARLEGVLEYDRASRRITRWDMASLGDYTGCWFAGNDGWKEATSGSPLPLGFAFEIDHTAYQVPAERRRPRSFVHAYIFREREPFYWDPELWHEDWKKRQR
ncbi:MAG: hypothetical protein FJ271_07980 [Planctomycetes bacterium]|nr:hypothetical protein [Planctomycetota bacterium]